MKNIPNILSVFRIILIPFFVLQMFDGNFFVAAIILVVSGLTDFLDGFLARRFGWVSAVGKILDPAADKLTQATVCVTLIILLRQYWFFFAALLFKELVMFTLGGYLVKNGIKLEGARWFGKVVTFLFYAVMVSILLMPNMPSWLVTTLLCIVTVCAFIAGAMYIPEYLKYKHELAERKAAGEQPAPVQAVAPPQNGNAGTNGNESA